MHLSKDKIQQFHALYKVVFGVELNDDEVSEKAQAVVTMLSLTYKSIPKKDLDILQKDANRPTAYDDS